MSRSALILAEVSGDPHEIGYAALLPDQPGHVVRLLNEQSRDRVASRMITARAILAECQDGAAILDKLESASASISAVKWAVKFLGQEAGIDVGSPATQGMITQLQQAGVITLAESGQLRAMAVRPCSRAEQLGLGVVTEQDLRDAGAI